MSSHYRKVAAGVIILTISKRKKLRKRSCWIKPWIDRRSVLSAGHILTRELQIKDAQQFRNFCRLTSCEVEFIIQAVGPAIFKKDTKMRKAISVRDRVLVTLRFFA